MRKEEIDKALCKRMGLSTSLFFERFEDMSPKEKKEIVDVCKECPVMKSCRGEALEKETTYGLWGGAFFKRGRIVRDYVAA
jgi:hypothetical protein